LPQYRPSLPGGVFCGETAICRRRLCDAGSVCMHRLAPYSCPPTRKRKPPEDRSPGGRSADYSADSVLADSLTVIAR